MNRRSFLTNMLKGVVACAILPGAVTYARKWKTLESGITTIEWGSGFGGTRAAMLFVSRVPEDYLGALNTELVLMRNLEFLKYNIVGGDDGRNQDEISPFSLE